MGEPPPLKRPRKRADPSSPLPQLPASEATILNFLAKATATSSWDGIVHRSLSPTGPSSSVATLAQWLRGDGNADECTMVQTQFSSTPASLIGAQRTPGTKDGWRSRFSVKGKTRVISGLTSQAGAAAVRDAAFILTRSEAGSTNCANTKLQGAGQERQPSSLQCSPVSPATSAGGHLNFAANPFGGCFPLSLDDFLQRVHAACTSSCASSSASSQLKVASDSQEFDLTATSAALGTIEGAFGAAAFEFTPLVKPAVSAAASATNVTPGRAVRVSNLVSGPCVQPPAKRPLTYAPGAAAEWLIMQPEAVPLDRYRTAGFRAACRDLGIPYRPKSDYGASRSDVVRKRQLQLRIEHGTHSDTTPFSQVRRIRQHLEACWDSSKASSGASFVAAVAQGDSVAVALPTAPSARPNAGVEATVAPRSRGSREASYGAVTISEAAAVSQISTQSALQSAVPPVLPLHPPLAVLVPPRQSSVSALPPAHGPYSFSNIDGVVSTTHKEASTDGADPQPEINASSLLLPPTVPIAVPMPPDDDTFDAAWALSAFLPAPSHNTASYPQHLLEHGTLAHQHQIQQQTSPQQHEPPDSPVPLRALRELPSPSTSVLPSLTLQPTPKEGEVTAAAMAAAPVSKVATVAAASALVGVDENLAAESLASMVTARDEVGVTATTPPSAVATLPGSAVGSSGDSCEPTKSDGSSSGDDNSRNQDGSSSAASTTCGDTSSSSSSSSASSNVKGSGVGSGDAGRGGCSATVGSGGIEDDVYDTAAAESLASMATEEGPGAFLFLIPGINDDGDGDEKEDDDEEDDSYSYL